MSLKIDKNLESQGILYMGAGISPKPVILKSVSVDTKNLKKADKDLEGDAKEAAYRTVLEFVFVTPTLAGEEGTEKVFKKIEYPLKDEAKKKAVDILMARIKHIYEAFTTFPEMRNCDGWGDLFTEVASMFNTGNGGKPIFKDDNGTPKPVWLHLIVNESNFVDTPDFPPFIEKAVKDRPTNLSKDRRYQYEFKETAQPLSVGGQPTEIPKDLPF